MSGRTLAKALTTTVVALAVIGSITAWILSDIGYLPGDAMVRAWSAAKDRPTDDHANGTWVVGDVAVRSRFDAVTGFGLAGGQNGKELWEYVPPGRAQICGSARHADASVLLVAYGEEGGETSKPAPQGKGCATVLALDVKDGRELWTAQRKVATGRFGQGSQFLDAGDDIAVVARDHRDARLARTKDDHTSLRALDLRTGKPRWTADMPDECGTHKVSVGKEQVFAVLECGGRDTDEWGFGNTDGAELMMAAFDRESGALNWNVPMDARRPLNLSATVAIESTDPLVLTVGRSTNLDTGTYFSFGKDGRPRPGIEFDGDYGKIAATDASQTAIVGERMYALAEFRDRKWQSHRLVAFDLTTGEEVWKETLDDPAAALSARGDRITVLGERSTKNRRISNLFEYDADNGEELDERHFRDDVPDPMSVFYEHEGRIIVAGWGGGHTFTAFERW
ncbi:PQQ-binding-like beta-propeller repeat protein [Streptomyces sp. NPDC058439]|uniref:outer membrane protein assembly factor BamB family protein n=1 Tax=Streptomyces sp. NPDC058439 TaxID=3346500 RepID=UPI00365C99DA